MQNVMMKMGQQSENLDDLSFETLSELATNNPKDKQVAMALKKKYIDNENERFDAEASEFANTTGMSVNQAKDYIRQHPLDYRKIPVQTTGQVKKEEKLLKDLGYAGAGAGLGGLGGYYLAKLIDDSATAKAIGTVLGTGLGGSLGYLYGNTAKDKLVQGYDKLMA